MTGMLRPGAALGAAWAIMALLAAPPALAVGDESLNQPTTQAPSCPAGETYNEACQACAKTCAEGQIWDCDKKACAQKASRRWSDEQLYAYAVSLIKTERYREARGLLWTIERREQPKVLNYIGYTTRKLGDVETGIAYYHKALALDPNYSKAREYLGEGYLQKNDVAGAKAQLAEIGKRCGRACPEYEALADAIAMHLSGEKLIKTW